MNSLYAMDTHFFTSMGSYGFDAHCEILEEIGYDATYLTLWTPGAWEDLAKLKDVKKRHGIETAAVLCHVETVRLARFCPKAAASRGSPKRWKDATPSNWRSRCARARKAGLSPFLREGHPTRSAMILRNGFWIASSPSANAAAYACCFIRTSRSGWSAVEDAVRLCRRIAHPNLGVVFCGYHWYAIDGKEVAAKLELAAPFLRHVNLCGARRAWAKMARHCTIEPLDDGELDNFALRRRCGESISTAGSASRAMAWAATSTPS